MIKINKNISNYFKTNYDYEEDQYDKLKNISKSNDKYRCFTNKLTLKKFEFDYEEDPYEPEKNR